MTLSTLERTDLATAASAFTVHVADERSHLMDALRVAAAHVIVLHHLASYGPLAAMLEQAWPWLAGVLYHYGRFATQVFLVMAGFLSMQGLMSSTRNASLAGRLARRYLRLVPPFLLAISGVALVVTLLRPAIDQDWLTAPPTVLQWLTHALLIQDLVGQPAMTVGAWYVAIDFQLFVTLNVLVWALLRLGAPQEATLVAVALLCLASQWYFNRDPAWDRWALYFFESYGMGALLAAVVQGTRVARNARRLAILCMVSAVTAGIAFPRPRLLLTVLVCLLLWWGVNRLRPTAARRDWLRRQSELSYSLFLTHFMPLVVANAIWIRSGGQSPAWGVALLALTWWACVRWSAAFHRMTQALMHRFSRA
jgi:peptidoglycan/LPS O-acetylase OafA/YrhL